MGASLSWPSMQVENLLVAWLGAITVLVYRVVFSGPAYWTPLVLLPRNLELVAVALTAVCIVTNLSGAKGTRSLWLRLSLCFALGLSCTGLTILLVS
jgi:hypothetical protein